jgi:glycerate 2-kinase
MVDLVPQSVIDIAALIESLGRAAIAACDGAALVRRALEVRPSAARVFLAVGKAAARMAEGAILAGVPARGLIVTKEPSDARVELLLAGHPQPDERSVRATERALSLARSVPAEEELLVLISGGTSALLGGPIEGVSLEEVRVRTDALLRSGATIDEMNTVRRQLGAALGGRLRAACRGRVRALILSDVLSGDVRMIGSGPLHGDPQLPVDATIIGDPALLLREAQRGLIAQGFDVDASLFRGDVATLVRELSVPLLPHQARVRVGEPTLVVTGQGEGGRAQHTALSLMRTLPDAHVALALASDGSDGPTAFAGGVAWRRDEDVAEALRRFDSGPMLHQLHARLATRPTGTNLTDLYIVARA